MSSRLLRASLPGLVPLTASTPREIEASRISRSRSARPAPDVTWKLLSVDTYATSGNFTFEVGQGGDR
jgi:methionine-rich copper-binding protein CopC